MQRKIKALITTGVVALVAAAMSGCGPEKYKGDTSGSEQYQQKVNQGQPLYTPPPGAPVPGAGGPGMAPGMAPGTAPGTTAPGTAPGAPR